VSNPHDDKKLARAILCPVGHVLHTRQWVEALCSGRVVNKRPADKRGSKSGITVSEQRCDSAFDVLSMLTKRVRRMRHILLSPTFYAETSSVSRPEKNRRIADVAQLCYK